MTDDVQDIVLRAGRRSDAAVVAPLIYSSAPPVFDYIFSQSRVEAVDFLTHCFSRSGGLFGYDNHVVAARGAQVLAVGAFYSGKGTVRRNLETGRRIVEFYRHRAARVAVRGLRVEALMPPPKRDEQYVAHLGVHPRARGTGIGTRMLDWQRDEAKKVGFGKMTLDVSIENARAEKLYKRLGYRTVWERDSTLRRGAIKVPGHRRMQVRID